MKEDIALLLSKSTSLKKEEVIPLIEKPKNPEFGDYSFPCFILAKKENRSPTEISKEIAASLSSLKREEYEKIEAKGPYVNFFLSTSFLTKKVLKKVLTEKEKYGSCNMGENKKVIIEFSSPNIAKPFGIGHLRSTIIGNSLSQIYSFLGFKVIKINYLGDWGTQFGKLLLGYQKFGSLQDFKKNPIKHLLEVYIKVNEDPSLEEEARKMFKKLELGDKKALSLWKKFKKISLKEFKKIYKNLNISFDVFSGESFYNEKISEIELLLKQKNLLNESEGALIVDLENYNLGKCLIKKSDETTLYASRDIAAAIDRYNKYHFDKMIYEVGAEQKLHFKQIFKILELLGYSWAKDCLHVEHGLYLDKDGKKLATRKGKTIFMEDILSETQKMAEEEVKKRFPKLSKKEILRRAKAIALAAIFYGDLKNYRANDIIFDIERFLSFEGDTGPYLLYSYARAKSILRKAKYSPKKEIIFPNEISDIEKRMLLHINSFQSEIENSLKTNNPSLIAHYAYSLSQIFNEFYHTQKVIGSENQQFKLLLVGAFSQVLKNALSLLGIRVLEKM